MPSAESSLCYTKVARTRFRRFPTASSEPTAVSGDGEPGHRILAVKAALTVLYARNRTVLRLVFSDAWSVLCVN